MFTFLKIIIGFLFIIISSGSIANDKYEFYIKVDGVFTQIKSPFSLSCGYKYYDKKLKKWRCEANGECKSLGTPSICGSPEFQIPYKARNMMIKSGGSMLIYEDSPARLP